MQTKRITFKKTLLTTLVTGTLTPALGCSLFKYYVPAEDATAIRAYAKGFNASFIDIDRYLGEYPPLDMQKVEKIVTIMLSNAQNLYAKLDPLPEKICLLRPDDSNTCDFYTTCATCRWMQKKVQSAARIFTFFYTRAALENKFKNDFATLDTLLQEKIATCAPQES